MDENRLPMMKVPHFTIPEFNITNPIRLDKRVLVLVETNYTPQSREIILLLQYNRFRYRIELSSKSLPNLTHREKGKYSLVIFERFESYLNMDKWNRELLDKYCKAYKIGIIAFTYPENILSNAQARGFPLSVYSKLSVKNYQVNPYSPVLRITKSGTIVNETIPGSDWTVFEFDNPTYSAIATAEIDTTNISTASGRLLPKADMRHATVVLDKGLYDGIQRVIFGHHLMFWYNKVLLLDVIAFLTHGRMNVTLDRYLLVDIDDIFVGRTGVRMKTDDVKVST
jgi:hypothetical protein